MSSPLGPALANSFKGPIEQKWLAYDHRRLLSFTVGAWTIFWKWESGSEFPQPFKQSTPKFKIDYRETAHEIITIFGVLNSCPNRQNYQFL